MNDLVPEYVAARRVLLDALTALGAHRDSLILVGAQAVYHHTGDADLNVPLMTTDADLAIDNDMVTIVSLEADDARTSAGSGWSDHLDQRIVGDQRHRARPRRGCARPAPLARHRRRCVLRWRGPCGVLSGRRPGTRRCCRPGPGCW